MPKLVNRAKMTTATTGTGTITLGSAVDGYQTFAAAGVADADVVRYVIEDGDAWEIGLGTYTASGTTLTRGSIESSNADNPINLSGTALVFLTVAGGDLQHAADMNQGVATTDSPTFAGLTATTADINGGTIDGTTIGGSTPAAGTFSSVTVNGNITVTGTVDGRDVAADGSKLDGIEANAKDDQTITAGAGLTGGGTGDVTISHADTSAQASVNNSGATVIQDVTLDTYGHITALGSATITPALIGAATSAQGTLADSATQPGDNISTLTNDAGYTTNIGDITGVTAGSGITGGGTSGSVTVSHADTSTQASVNNTGATFIQDVTLDTYGHVTGLGSATLGLSDFGVTATATELNILDGANATLAPALLANPQNYLDPENRVINGAFDFWQRGTSQTTYGYGSADRWLNGAIGGTVTMSRQSFTLGDTLGGNSPTYFLRQTVSGQTLSSELTLIEQRIESVRSYAGQTITVLGWARRSSGSGNMAFEAVQVFGTGGSPSSAVLIAPQTITLTGSWTPFAVTVSVPSITGKTLGSNGNDNLEINFYTSAGSDFNARTNSLGLQTIGVDLWGIHIKVGTHTADATSLYRQPELGPELARCQRYYETGPAQMAGPCTSSVRNISTISFCAVKRTAPSMVFSGSTAVGAVSTGNYAPRDVTVRSFAFDTGDATGTGAYIAATNFTADAEL